MLASGLLCGGCSPAACSDCPSQASPAEVACPSCEERGCRECGGTGYFAICACPYEWLDDNDNGDTATLCRMARLFSSGAMPVAGGVLDQAAWFVEFAEFYGREVERMKPNPFG